jgi:hypothetical protein
MSRVNIFADPNTANDVWAGAFGEVFYGEQPEVVVIEPTTIRRAIATAATAIRRTATTASETVRRGVSAAESVIRRK